jgi:predicted secreted protein
MKIFRLLCGVGAVAALAASASIASARTIIVTEANNNQTVRMETGDIIIVQLETNPSTGFSWSVSFNNTNLLQPVREPEIARLGGMGGNRPGVGRPQVQEFGFRAMAPGRDGLVLSYSRGSGRAERQFSVIVEVEGATDPNTVVLTERDRNRRITINRNQMIEVQLPYNASTGFTWGVLLPNDSIVQQVGNVRIQQPPTVRPGAGGMMIWRFRPASNGVQWVKFVQFRPFEQGINTSNLFEFQVTVRR